MVDSLHKFWHILAAFLILVLIGAGAYFSLNAKTSAALLPEGEVLSGAFSAFSTTTSWRVDSQIKFEVQPVLVSGVLSPAPLIFSLHYVGQNSRQGGEFSGEISVLGLPTNPFLTENQLNLGFTLKYFPNGQTAYLQVSRLPSVLSLLLGLSGQKNSWLKFDLDKIVELKDGVRNLAFVHGLVDFVAQTAGQTMDGVSVEQYHFVVNREGLTGFISSLMPYLNRNLKLDNDSDSQSQFQTQLNALAMPEGELWIGHDDLLPYKFSLTGQIDNFEGQNENLYNLNYYWESNYRRFGQPFNIEPPAEFIDLEEILTDLELSTISSFSLAANSF